MKKISFIILLFLYWGLSKAQVYPQHYIHYDSISEYAANGIIKFSYLSLADFKQSIQFAYEYKISPRITFQNELGYINTLIKGLYDYRYFQDMKGIRTRFEARFYQTNRYNQVKGFYIGPEFFYVHTQYQREAELGRGCVSGICDFFERKRYQIYKNVGGIHFKAGHQSHISSKFLIDVYGGLGLRMVYLRAPDVEVEDRRGGEFTFRYDRGRFLRPSMALGFKLGYIIK